MTRSSEHSHARRVYVDFCRRLFGCGLIEFVRSATELESPSMEALLWKWVVWTFQMPFTTLNFPKSLGPFLLWIPSGHGTLESSLVKVKQRRDLILFSPVSKSTPWIGPMPCGCASAATRSWLTNRPTSEPACGSLTEGRLGH